VIKNARDKTNPAGYFVTVIDEEKQVHNIGFRKVSLSVFCPSLGALSSLRSLQSIHLHGIALGNHHKSLAGQNCYKT
jgi:ribosomal protein S11